MTESRSAAPAALHLRPGLPGLPEPTLQPPQVAESDDPFSALRVIHVLARLERGRPFRLDDVAAALNAIHLDWLFSRSVVTDVALQLQANWLADYRNSSGIVLDDSPHGPTISIEDSSRVDPWIVRQAERTASECRQRLLAFSRLDRVASGG